MSNQQEIMTTIIHIGTIVADNAVESARARARMRHVEMTHIETVNEAVRSAVAALVEQGFLNIPNDIEARLQEGFMIRLGHHDH